MVDGPPSIRCGPDFLLCAVLDIECKQRAWLLFTYAILVAERLFPPPWVTDTDWPLDNKTGFVVQSL